MHTNAVCGGWMLACMLAFQGSNCHNTNSFVPRSACGSIYCILQRVKGETSLQIAVPSAWR